MKRVKIKLRRPHYHNSIRKRPGQVIVTDELTAKWLVAQKVGKPVK